MPLNQLCWPPQAVCNLASVVTGGTSNSTASAAKPQTGDDQQNCIAPEPSRDHLSKIIVMQPSSHVPLIYGPAAKCWPAAECRRACCSACGCSPRAGAMGNCRSKTHCTLAHAAAAANHMPRQKSRAHAPQKSAACRCGWGSAAPAHAAAAAQAPHKSKQRSQAVGSAFYNQ